MSGRSQDTVPVTLRQVTIDISMSPAASTVPVDDGYTLTPRRELITKL